MSSTVSNQRVSSVSRPHFTAAEIAAVRGDNPQKLHCLVNACRHRWARVVDEGTGNKTVLMCPYHRWTYNLDGTLRAISRESIPGFDKHTCSLPSIRLEVWEGTIFINFDQEAAPLAPQLSGLDPLIGHFKLGEMRTVGRVNYDTTWNYKYSVSYTH